MGDELVEKVMQTKKELEIYCYGFKNLFLSSLDEKGLFLKIPNIRDLKEFDCVHYAIKGRELLAKKGINTSIFFGKDTCGVWENHVYLRFDNEKIDFTPLYPVFGENVFNEKKISEDEIQQCEGEHLLSLSGMLPFHFDLEENILFRVGIKSYSFDGFVRYYKPIREAYVDVVLKEESYIIKGPLIIEKNKNNFNKKNFVSFFENEFLSLNPSSKDISFILEKSRGLKNNLLPFLSRIL